MDKKAVRQALIDQRLNMPNRLERAEQLQQVLRFWLTEREDTVTLKPSQVLVIDYNAEKGGIVFQ